MAGPRSWSGTQVRASVSNVIEGADELTSAVTSVLSPDGPLGFTGTLTNALDSVWADFFGAATPPGATNWNAYTHQQLYDMVWQGADVGDVSDVAAEWGRHSTVLTGFADALRGQVTALRSNWQGRAAESAADRLAELSDRIWNSGARAGTVQKAAGNAGDALALARSTMPRPPPDPLTLMASAVGAGPLPPLEAIAVGGARLFTGDAAAGAAKAQAVRVMQRYETSLRNSGNQVVPAPADATRSDAYQVDGQAGATTGPDTTTSAAGFAGGPAGGRGAAGVPWARLAGAAPLGSGPVSGAGPVSSVLAAEDAMQSELAAQRAMSPAGFVPPMAARPGQGGDDRPHRSHMPNVDSRFFMSDERVTVPVIGENTDQERDVGR